MKPFAILIIVFLVALGIARLITGDGDLFLPGRIAMAVMLLFTAIGHFKFTQGMAMMLPSFVPFRTALVYLTGFMEIAAAIALLIPSLAYYAGWFLLAFFALLLPANIYAALNKVDYEKGTYEGPGAAYLWFRVPLQLLFIGWVYFFVIRQGIQ